MQQLCKLCYCKAADNNSEPKVTNNTYQT